MRACIPLLLTLGSITLFMVYAIVVMATGPY